MIRAFLCLLFALPLAAPALASRKESPASQHHHDMQDEAPAAPHDHSIYLLDSVWLDASGKHVPLVSLRGKAIIAAMIYTSCTYTCPLVVDEMKRIEKLLDPAMRGQVTFVLWSFDPERDRPEALERYRRKRELDPARWVLLTSDPDAVQELAAVLGVRYRKEADGEFSHSVLIHVLDRDGTLVYQQAGLNKNSQPLLAALQKSVR